MAIGHNQITIGVTPVLIVPLDPDGCRGSIYNMGNVSVYLGGVSVTISNGYELVKKESIPFVVGIDEGVYGVVEKGTAKVCYLATLNQ